MKSPNRRQPGRPHDGETRACLACVRGTLEFRERAQLCGTKHITPAWICNRCGAIAPVRATDSSPAKT
jgi:hypothetical protein